MRLTFLMLCCLLLALPQPAHAQRSIRVETVSATTPNGKPAVALMVNGITVAKLAKPMVIGGAQRSPQRGIAMAAALITEAYRSGVATLSVQQVDADGKRYSVLIGGKPLLVATDVESKAWGVSTAELARTWRKNLEQAWGGAADQPVESGAPEIEPTEATPDEPVYVPKPVAPKPKPKPVSPPMAVAQDPTLLGDVPGGAGGTLEAKPALPAAGQPVSPTADFSRVEIKSNQHAYEPPQQTTLQPMSPPARYVAQVTGASPSAEIVEQALVSTLKASAGLPSAATIVWTPSDPEFVMPPIAPGIRVAVPLTYKVNGMGSPVPAEVVLENRKVTPPRESLTLFSNAPENVKRSQLLYHAQIPGGQSGRLVYHHMNQAPDKLVFVARAVNTSGEPAALHVIPGGLAANINTFFAGFKSAENFWNNLNSGSGYVLSVPAGGQAYIATHPMQPGYTASGYYKLTNMSGSTLRIETLALPSGSEAPKGPYADESGASRGVFPEPYLTTRHEYKASGPNGNWLYLRLGEELPDSSTDSSVHYGCYGVTHTYEVTVTNPGGQPALVFIILRGSAGEVKGQFYIDSDYIATALVPGGEEQLLKEVPLKPGQSRTLRIKAIALNGGFYPASIILRETRTP